MRGIFDNRPDPQLKPTTGKDIIIMTQLHGFCNFDDVIDSRDVIAKINDLEEKIEGLQENLGSLECIDDSADRASATQEMKDEMESLQEELKPLLELQEQAHCSPDWNYGAMLIRDSYFEEYARELAKDRGAIRDDLNWPYTCIDWQDAACELQQDYVSVDYDGVTYWVR